MPITPPLNIGARPGPAGPALAGSLLGELFNSLDLYCVAYKKRPSVVDGGWVYIVCPVYAVACMLTHPQYGCIWE